MRFLEHLVKETVLPRDLFDSALRQHGRKERILLRALRDQIGIAPQELLERLSSFYKFPIVNLDVIEKDPQAMQLIPYETAKRYGVFPIRVKDGKLSVAVSDPTDVVTFDTLRFVSDCHIECSLALETDIRDAIEKYYRLEENLEDALRELARHHRKIQTENVSSQMVSVEDSHSPVSKTIQCIVEDAIQRKASDIHFEPQEKSVELRYRIDGELTLIQTLPLQSYSALVVRIKILSHLDIAERRKPQDGRARLVFRDKKIDLRVSTLTTIFGEKVVIRLLNHESLAVDSIEGLHFDPEQHENFLKAIQSKQGIVLITGPTGSGKTTTLYTSLKHIRSEKNNITTIEDPIEYLLEGINQTQISPKIGVTFASVLRNILRQDPDVILVGEIRDRETAEMAFRSSLTGHLVFSTLHTNSAIGAVTRLYDLGLEPYLVASALLCVVAQQLVRAICPDCREVYYPSAELMESLKSIMPNDPVSVFFRGKGCPKCGQSGFRGRVALFEVLPVVEEVRSAISSRCTEDVLYRRARRQGFKSMAEFAMEKVGQGIIRLEEALPYLQVFQKNENDLFMKLADFIDQNQKTRLLIVKNDELARKIMRNVSPEEYVVIGDNAHQEFSEAGADHGTVLPVQPLLPDATKEESIPAPDRRRFPRIDHDFVLRFRSTDLLASAWEAAIIKNLSEDGCSFQVPSYYPVGSKIEMHVQLPISKDFVPVNGVVRHCQHLSEHERFHSLGVTFENQKIENRNLFARVVGFFLSKKPKP